MGLRKSPNPAPIESAERPKPPPSPPVKDTYGAQVKRIAGRWVHIPDGPRLWIPYTTPVEIGSYQTEGKHYVYLNIAGLGNFDNFDTNITADDLQALLDGDFTP